MKKIINFLKKNTFGFIIGTILFGGIAVVYATTIASNTVDYENSANTDVATVQDALDDLYSKIMPLPVIACYNGTCGKLTYKYWNNNFAGSTGANLFDSTHMPAINYASRAALETAYGASNFADNPIYIRSVLIDGNVVGHESCFWEANNEKEFCISPNYWAGTIGTNDATVGTNTKIKLQRDMQNALSLESTDISCGSDAYGARCGVSDFVCDADSDGSVHCASFVTYGGCLVGADGSAHCNY